MCGFVGIVSDKDPINRIELINAAHAIQHRGPDHQGIWMSDDGLIGFAHRRLSIVDLSPEANQPMIAPDKFSVVIFNGEIYNFLVLRQQLQSEGFLFTTKSDTEVLLAAYKKWGTECIQYLDGMFSFAIYDQTQNIIFFARDRAGEKPLYIYQKENILLFGSEVKAFFSFPFFDRKINYSSLEYALSYGYLPSGTSIYLHVIKLLPGEKATYDLKQKRLFRKQYWKIQDSHTGTSRNENEWLEKCEQLLSASVNQQLYADVPVGILLSGGVDSSLITALATKQHSKINTFTITFGGYGRYDEKSHARLIADYFGTNHHEIESDIIQPEILPIIAEQFDEPMFDSSAIPTYYVSKAIRSVCKVALGGDGADELFGGYQSCRKILRFNSIHSLVAGMHLDKISQYLFQNLPTGFRGKNLLGLLAANYNHSLPLFPPLFKSDNLADIFKNKLEWSLTSFDMRAKIVRPHHSLLTRAMLLDFEQYLPEDILVKMDRMSMLNSLEVRSPFLSQQILEFSFSIPENLKANKNDTKILLRKLAKKILPPSFDLKRKQGFSIPLKQWLNQSPWNSYCKDILLDSGSSYNPKAIHYLFKDQESGRSNNERIYALVMLELWQKKYNINLN